MLQALDKRRAAVVSAIAAIGLISAAAGIQAAAKVSDSSPTAVITALPNAGHAGRAALIIANADYPDASAPLSGSLDDAQALAERLRERGFTVTFAANATKVGMGEAVDHFAATIKPGMTALVAFSGYGIQAHHENYLIPTDAQIWKESDVRREGTSVSALLAKVTAHGGTTVAILDASRRNPFERRFRDVSGGLAAVEPPRGTLVLSTATPGRTIGDDGQAAHAVRLLSDAMTGTATDAETLFNRTRQRVSQASKGEQVPSVSSTLLDNVTL